MESVQKQSGAEVGAGGAGNPAPNASDLERAATPYTTGERVRRVLWNYVGQTLFRFTFHNWYGCRASLLRVFGARVGRCTRIRPSVIVEQPWNLTIGANSSIADRAIVYCLGKVTIGANCSISQYAHLCAGTHEYQRPDMRIEPQPITLGREVWIAADAFVGPGVTVNDGSMLAARSSAFQDMPEGMICIGEPAKPVKRRG